MVNVIKFRLTWNFLLLATLAMRDKFLSSYERKDRDIETGPTEDNEGSSSREIVGKTPK
jgi:hypothetical protein